MKIIDSTLRHKLASHAISSDRKRVSFNLHDSFSDSIQRMINVLEPGTYLCPHMHKNPPKNEIFVILQGKLLVCLFDDHGSISDHVILDRDSGRFVIEIPSGIWHTIIPLSVHTAIFECKEGPYDPKSDKLFAPWAPEEGSHDTMNYNKKILDTIGFVFPEFT